MDRFQFPNDTKVATNDVKSMRHTVGDYIFYLVLETVASTSAGYDPIYGEPYDVFTSASYIESTSYLPFRGSILRQDKDSELLRPGFYSQKSLVVDVAPHQGISWEVGMLVMFNGCRYRLTKVDYRGMDYENRAIISMSEVTG